MSSGADFLHIGCGVERALLDLLSGAGKDAGFVAVFIYLHANAAGFLEVGSTIATLLFHPDWLGWSMMPPWGWALLGFWCF